MKNPRTITVVATGPCSVCGRKVSLQIEPSEAADADLQHEKCNAAVSAAYEAGLKAGRQRYAGA